MISITKEEKALLKSFIENKELVALVRRALTEKIYEQGNIKNSGRNFVFSLDLANDDATYGNKIKTVVKALYEVEEAFQAMTLATADQPVPSKPINKSR